MHLKEADYSSRLGGLMAYFRGMPEGDRLRGGGEAPGAVVVTGSTLPTTEGRVKRDFSRSEGAVAMGIWQAWWGRWRGGGVRIWKQLVSGTRVNIFWYAGMEGGDVWVGG